MREPVSELETTPNRTAPVENEHHLRAILDRHPNDDVARRALAELLGDRTPPRDSNVYRATRAILPDRFIEHETRRFLVFSDADPNWTRLQAERLERAHHQFMRFTGQLDLVPLPLRHKLICVLFQNQGDYHEFAAMHDEVNARWIDGYYSPRHDRIVFYNVESGRAVNRARQQIAGMQAEIATLREQAATARRNGHQQQAVKLEHQARQYDNHLREQQSRLDRFTADTIIATTVHEAVHQLAFHTMIQHARVHYPLWISEGLATAFETNVPNQAFGPGYEHAHRREAFTAMLRDDELLPLRSLITIVGRESPDDVRLSVVYPQSYAFVTWMHRFRRAELRDYLRLMRTAPHRPMSDAEHIDLFTQAFGEIDSLERAWLRHERTQSTAGAHQ